MTISVRLILLCCALGLGSAAARAADPAGPGPVEQSLAGEWRDTPPQPGEAGCFARQTRPAVIETVTEQVVARPAKLNEDGSLLRPAVYKTETVQRIVRERVETWFERPCDEVLTEEFVASLQRALAVRNLYHGPVTGRMDSRTEAAVRRYQKPLGLDTGILTLETARKLGLVAIALKKG